MSTGRRLADFLAPLPRGPNAGSAHRTTWERGWGAGTWLTLHHRTDSTRIAVARSELSRRWITADPDEFSVVARMASGRVREQRVSVREARRSGRELVMDW